MKQTNKPGLLRTVCVVATAFFIFSALFFAIMAYDIAEAMLLGMPKGYITGATAQQPQLILTIIMVLMCTLGAWAYWTAQPSKRGKMWEQIDKSRLN